LQLACAYVKLNVEQGQNKKEINMRGKRREFGRLILIGIFILVAVVLPAILNVLQSSAGNLGDF
jgi:hypothetical protein